MASEVTDNKHKDFTANWVTTSKFLFYLHLVCFAVFLFGACAKLYTQRYKGKPDIEVQSSSKYTPEYK